MVRLHDNKSSRIFICYAEENKDVAPQIYDLLQRAGLKVFVDIKQLVPGRGIPEQINDGIEWCDTFFLLWSKYAARSYWVSEEWQTAFSLKRRIISCILDKKKPLPSPLNSRVYIDFANNEDLYSKLLSELGVMPDTENTASSEKAEITIVV